MEFKSGYLLALLSVAALAVSIVNFIQSAASKSGVQSADVALFIMAIAIGVLSLRLYAAEQKLYGAKKAEDEPEETEGEEEPE